MEHLILHSRFKLGNFMGTILKVISGELLAKQATRKKLLYTKIHTFLSYFLA
jgi:hypothetical protein